MGEQVILIACQGFSFVWSNKITSCHKLKSYYKALINQKVKNLVAHKCCLFTPTLDWWTAGIGWVSVFPKGKVKKKKWPRHAKLDSLAEFCREEKWSFWNKILSLRKSEKMALTLNGLLKPSIQNQKEHCLIKFTGIIAHTPMSTHYTQMGNKEDELSSW